MSILLHCRHELLAAIIIALKHIEASGGRAENHYIARFRLICCRFDTGLSFGERGKGCGYVRLRYSNPTGAAWNGYDIAG